MRRILEAFTLMMVSSCTSYKQDLETLCNLDTLSSEVAQTSPAERASAQAKYLTDHVKSSRGIELMKGLAGVSVESRAEILRKEMVSQGIVSCPFVDNLLKMQVQLQKQQQLLQDQQAQLKKMEDSQLHQEGDLENSPLKGAKGTAGPIPKNESGIQPDGCGVAGCDKR